MIHSHKLSGLCVRAGRDEERKRKTHGDKIATQNHSFIAGKEQKQKLNHESTN